MTNMNNNSLKKAIMQYDFVAKELVLFLDTHPCDIKAIEMHAAVVNKANELKREYAKHCGPITTGDVGNEKSWIWLESPWPWEN